MYLKHDVHLVHEKVEVVEEKVEVVQEKVEVVIQKMVVFEAKLEQLASRNEKADEASNVLAKYLDNFWKGFSRSTKCSTKRFLDALIKWFKENKDKDNKRCENV